MGGACYARWAWMRIIAKKTLRAFWEAHEDARGALQAWHADVARREWASPNELKKDYPKASIVANNRAVFNIVGNRYRLIVAIKYADRAKKRDGIAFVKFIGTHEEYDDVDASTVGS